MYTFWLLFFIMSSCFLLALLVDDYLSYKKEREE
tara:strand:+ start:1113 stop:1214 length:102 start_codon:yes stop_codon:yes gene_type:complete